LLENSHEVGLQINIDNAKYMVLSRYQNEGQNSSTLSANKSFKNVVKFEYLGTTVTKQN